MDNNKLLGGVTPLKKRQGNRGGKAAGAATATSKQRGGFAEASGGSGGRNVAGYNVNTRFKAEPWKAPPGGGSAPAPKPAVTVDKKTGDVINNYGGDTNTNNSEVEINGAEDQQVWVPGEEGTDGYYETKTTEPGERPSYAEAWDQMGDDDGGGKKNKYGKKFTTYEDFEKEAKQWNKDNPGYKSEGGTTRVWVPGKAGKPGYYKTVKSTGGSGNISVDVNQDAGGEKNSAGKFTMRAHPFYRNYGIGGEPKKK
jgi:hypothetical protein